jgi:DNA-dependent RNA polymerase auxiliary subunit epsilon
MFDHPAFAEGEIVGNGDVRQVVYGNDKGMHVEFRMEDVHQEYESEQQGRPIYKQEPFIRMYTPGDKTKVVDRAVRLKPQGDIPADPQRFPTQWNAFRAGAEQVAAGTPLAQWPQITSSQVRELNAVNIWTVEALAEVSDAALDGVGHGGRALRDGAKLWLDAAQDNSVLSRMAANNQHLQEQIDALTAQLSLANSDEPRRGPGRPRKEEVE